MKHFEKLLIVFVSVKQALCSVTTQNAHTLLSQQMITSLFYVNSFWIVGTNQM
jgi:hypothetical protein